MFAMLQFQQMRVSGFNETITWYDQNAEQYTQACENMSLPDEIEKFVDSLPKNAKVLDAGCGGGRDASLLKKRGVGVTGIDLSSGLIKVAKEKHPDIDFVEGNFLRLPFEDKSFDGIWNHASLLHLETVDEVKTALGEFERVLKNGGILYTKVKAQTGSDKTAVVRDSLSNHERFFQYFTMAEIQTLLNDSGFEIVNLDQYNEADKMPPGRSEVEWIVALSKKS